MISSRIVNRMGPFGGATVPMPTPLLINSSFFDLHVAQWQLPTANGPMTMPMTNAQWQILNGPEPNGRTKWYNDSANAKLT